MDEAFVERLAGVALVLGRERASALLEGLAPEVLAHARSCLSRWQALGTAERHARLSCEFGLQPDAAQRLRAGLGELPDALQEEVVRRLPPYLRSLFPCPEVTRSGVQAPPAALALLAERFIRETTR